MVRKAGGSGLFNFCSSVTNKDEIYYLKLRVMWKCNPDEYNLTLSVEDSKETLVCSSHHNRKFSMPENAIKEIRREYELYKRRLEQMVGERKQITETFFKD